MFLTLGHLGQLLAESKTCHKKAITERGSSANLMSLLCLDEVKPYVPIKYFDSQVQADAAKMCQSSDGHCGLDKEFVFKSRLWHIRV